MSKVYYQLSRETGRFIKKMEGRKAAQLSGKFLKDMPSKNARNNAGKTDTEFVGVSFCSRSLKWRAYITIGGKMKSLGLYDTDTEAAKAYDRIAAKVGRQTNILKKA